MRRKVRGLKKRGSECERIKEKMLYIDEESPAHCTKGGLDSVTEYKDIVSVTILLQLWHIADNIFKNLDAVSLLQCEKVCELWKHYLIRERVWQKKLFHRSGPISWKLLPSAGRAISVYGSGKGFILKIHDNLGFKFRSSHFNSAGTVKNDTLCMDATESKIVVAGYNSQKVWVFSMEEEDVSSLTIVPDFLAKMSQLTRPRTKNLVTKLTKFIAATGGVTKVQMHSDNDRLAVLLPHSQSVEIWNIQLVTRLHRFVLTPDASFLIWKKDTLISAPLYSGVVQVFNTNTYEEKQSLVGFFRKIDALAAFENLAVTAETRTIRLWKLSSCITLASWEATKTYISALYMNDTMIVSGSGAGIVKIWDLPSLLQMPAGSPVTPLRKINMKGILHYPVKEIYQCTYTDLVIIAKYEGKKKKDKVKIVEVKWN